MCKNVGVINNAVGKNKHIPRGRTLGVSKNNNEYEFEDLAPRPPQNRSPKTLFLVPVVRYSAFLGTLFCMVRLFYVRFFPCLSRERGWGGGIDF